MNAANSTITSNCRWLSRQNYYAAIDLFQHHPGQQYTVCTYPGLNRPGGATQCWGFSVMTAEHRSVRCQAHADLSKISRNEICISG